MTTQAERLDTAPQVSAAQALEKLGFPVVRRGGGPQLAVIPDDSWETLDVLRAAGYTIRGDSRLLGTVSDGESSVNLRLMGQSADVVSCVARQLVAYDTAPFDDDDSILDAFEDQCASEPGAGRAHRLLAKAGAGLTAQTFSTINRLTLAADAILDGGEFGSALPPAEPPAEILAVLIDDLHPHDYGDPGAVIADLLEHPGLVTTAIRLARETPAPEAPEAATAQRSTAGRDAAARRVNVAAAGHGAGVARA